MWALGCQDSDGSETSGWLLRSWPPVLGAVKFQDPPDPVPLSKRNQGVGQAWGRETGSRGHWTPLWSGPLCQHFLGCEIALQKITLAVPSPPPSSGSEDRP